MKDEKKSEKGWRKIYEFKDGKITAVVHDPYDRGEVMILDPPHLIGVMNEKRKKEFLKWLVPSCIRKLHCMKNMNEEKKEKILRLLILLLIESEP